MKRIRVSPFSMFHVQGDEYYINNTKHTEKVILTETNVKILHMCQQPIPIEKLQQEFGFEEINSLCDAGILIDADLVWKYTYVKVMDIEISTNCNWKCSFCPLHQKSKGKKVMSINLYRHIIEKIARHTTVEAISINGYSEPSLDPFFQDRIDILKEYDIKLIFNTNGSTFTKDKVNYILQSEVLSALYFNLPSADESEFERITSSKTYEKTMQNIEYVLEKGITVHILCQGKGQNHQKNYESIVEKFGRFQNAKIIKGTTCDRAGNVKTEFNENVYITKKLGGCIKPINNIFITVDGNLTFCGHDFEEKYVYGNIRDGEILEILNSELAIEYRKKIFDVIPAESDFICRHCFDMKLRCANRTMEVKALDCFGKEDT